MANEADATINFCGYDGSAKLSEICVDVTKDVNNAGQKYKEFRSPAVSKSAFDLIFAIILNSDKIDSKYIAASQYANYVCNGNSTFRQNVGRGCQKNGGVRQLILTGAPGTGKTYMATKVAGELAEQAIVQVENDLLAPVEIGKTCEFVQFHPSYDYSDFVEGLRPVEINGQVTFKKMDGIFKQFCRTVVAANAEVAEHAGKHGAILPVYFFIIDEINRADLSKVLGELMFGLETDKRGAANRFQTQYANLPTYDIAQQKNIAPEDDCFAAGFYIPKNIVIIVEWSN